jgi:subtilase family serine protease
MRTDLHPIPNGSGIPAGVGFTAAQIESAYKLNVGKGAGQHVYIIDAFGYKTAESDLKKYRAAAGLAPCTTSNKCLAILNQEGKASPLPAPGTGNNSSWQIEQSLDLDAVSATCPKCSITLIQSNNNDSLYTAVTAAIGLGADIVSMSFGGGESKSTPPFPSKVVFVASAGDSGGGLKDGGGPSQPCTYAAVVCVGGTALVQTGTGWSQTVWDDLALDECYGPCGATGSACSKYVQKPSWQNDTGCKTRSAADVAADAAVTTPLAVYNSAFPGSHWAGIGGTSLAAPLIAGVFGLAGNAKTFGTGAEAIWKNHASMTNITVGTNVLRKVTGPCASSVTYICIAGSGYNGPTGWGTPIGSKNF